MYDALIKLNSIKDLYSFVDILDKHSGTFEIVANDYVVDARSLMSMLSLDLCFPHRILCGTAEGHFLW